MRGAFSAASTNAMAMEYASCPVEQPSTQTAERIVAALLEQLGQDLALERVERFGVAEEARHADEHVGVERIELLGVASRKCGVVLQRVRAW